MSKRFLVPALLLGLAGLGGWAVAQQNQPERPGAVQRFSRYTALAAGQTAILLETTTGKTWLMTQSVDGDSVWLPAQKLESEEAARRWLAKERQRGEMVTEVQREMARRLETLRSGPGRKPGPEPEKDKR